MKKTNFNYVLSTDKLGVYRLKLLDEAYWKYSRAFLLNSGSKPGMIFADLGCGIGHALFRIAKEFDFKGEYWGVDNSRYFLNMAKVKCNRNCFNFKNEDVLEEDNLPLDYFDVVYSRYLLDHLPNPENTLDYMMRLAKEGGVVCVEVVDFDNFVCYPENHSFQKFVEIYRRTVINNAGDPLIGRKLAAMFKKSGLHDVCVNLVIPLCSGKEETRRLIPLTFRSARQAILKTGTVTGPEYDTILRDIENLSESDDYIFTLAPTFQASGFVTKNK